MPQVTLNYRRLDGETSTGDLISKGRVTVTPVRKRNTDDGLLTTRSFSADVGDTVTVYGGTYHFEVTDKHDRTVLSEYRLVPDSGGPFNVGQLVESAQPGKPVLKTEWKAYVDDKLAVLPDLIDIDDTINQINESASQAQVVANIAASDAAEALSAVGDKVDKVGGKGLSTEDFTSALRTKLVGVDQRANHTGTQGIVTINGLQGELDSKASQQALNDGLGQKVDIVVGKGLSDSNFTVAEKSKLSAVATGATANDTDSALRDRGTHTGSQAISTVTGLQGDLDAKASAIAAKVDENSLVFNAKKAGGGIKGDRQSLKSASMTSGSATLTQPGTAVAFVSGDVGKAIIVAGAGPAGATLRTTITARNSSTSITLAATASTTVSNAWVIWGTDDTAALQAAVNAATTTSSNPIRSGELLIPKGSRCMITDTIVFSRWAGSLSGAGVSDWSSGYGADSYGSLLFWDGPSGKPLLRFEGARTIRIKNLALIGNPIADCRPSALLQIQTLSGLTSDQATVENCVIGKYQGYGGFDGTWGQRVADVGILFDGVNTVNDRFRILGGWVQGCDIALKLANTQSVLGFAQGTSFVDNGTHVSTVAQLRLLDVYLAKASVRDLDISSTAKVVIDEMGNELSASFARLRGESSLVVNGGYYQLTGDLLASGQPVIDAVDNYRQVVRLKDLRLNVLGGWPTAPFVPPILVQAHAASDSADSNKVIELDGVRCQTTPGYGITPTWLDVTPVGSLESVTVYGHVQPAGSTQSRGVEQFFYNVLRSPSDVLDFRRDDQTKRRIASPATFIADVAALTAGSTIYFPPGTYVSPTGTGNGVVVPADNITIEMSVGAEIQVPTWGQPGIDCLGRNGIRIVGSGTIRYTGTRGNHTGTIRGGATYTAGAGVYINGDRCEVNGLRTIDMPTGVYLSSWDGSALYGHRGQANIIRNLESSGMDFAVLYTAQDDLTLENIYGHDDVDDSSGTNPTHVIYGSATNTARARGITVSNLKARNLLYGQPFQFKYQDSGTMTGLVAADSRGVLNLHGCTDLEVQGVVSTGTKALLTAPNGALTVQDTSTARVKIRNVTIIVDSAGVNQRMLYMYCTDGVLENVQIISKRSSVDSVGIAQVVGDRFSVRNITCIETGSAGVGLVVGDIANSLTSADVQVEGVRLTGVLRGIDVWGTGSGSIRYNRGSISSSSDQVKRQTGTGGTGQYDVFRDNILTVAGSPEGVTTAPVGTVAQRSDGSGGTSLYIKESGSGNTGWRAIAIPAAGADIQEFTSSGTWTKPVGTSSTSTTEVILIAGGSGGGSGRRGASGSVCGGGGGGAGGAYQRQTYVTTDLGSTETVTVGAGGAGGAAVTADSTNGNAGTMGGTTSFGASGRRAEAANCGSVAAGGGGTTSGGAGGWGADAIGTNSFIGGGGSGGTGAAGVGVNQPVNGPAGGGGGGGISATPAAFNGGTSATSRMAATSSGWGAGGVVDSTSPTSGTNPTFRGAPGQGAGGGAASITTTAQTGAAGTGYGSGGGGGGASLNGNNSGAGGAGGPGYCLVITRF